MANEITTSKQFTVNFQDIFKGVIVAAASAVVTAVYAALTTVPPHFDLKQIGIVGLTAGLGYVIKNFFTPAQTVITGKAQPPTE